MNKKTSYWYLLPLFVCLLSVIGSTNLHTRGEAREALVVQKMYSTGDFILPKAYGDSIPSKPPLFHWIGSSASLLFGGVTEFSVRLPSVITAIFGIIYFLSNLMSYWEKTGSGNLFILILSLSFEWLRASVTARVDMVHSSFLACGLLASFLAVKNSRFINWLCVSLLFGLATLAKGPVALVLPALIISSWIFLKLKEHQIRALIPTCAALAASMVIAATWYFAAYLNSPAEFADKFWYENVARFAGTMPDEPHSHSVFYLLVMLCVGTLPWSGWGTYHLLKKKVNGQKIITWFKQLEDIEKFSLWVIIVIFCFYSIPQSKRGVYLLASYPFISLLIASTIAKLKSPLRSFTHTVFLAGLVAVTSFQLFLAPAIIVPHSDETNISNAIGDPSTEPLIFSYGREFYAASFYSGRCFYRLENELGRLTSLSDQDLSKALVVVESNNYPDLRNLITKQAIEDEIARTAKIGNKEVLILKLRKQV